MTGTCGAFLQATDRASDKTGFLPSASASLFVRDPEPTREGTCTGNGINLREGPSTNFKKIGTLDKGDKVYVYYRSGSWYRIMDRTTGKSAFIYKSYIRLGSAVGAFLRGDADGSGTLTAADAARVLRYLCGGSALDGAALLAADYTRDGTVDEADAEAILRYMVGME